MIMLDVVLGYLATWTLRRAGHAGQHIDDRIDQAVDAGLDQLNDIVMSKLRGEPALAQFRQETLSGQRNPRTRRRVVLALEDAVAQDQSFAASLQQALERINAVDKKTKYTINSPWVSGDGNKVATAGGIIDSNVTTNNFLNQHILAPILESTIPGRILSLAGIVLFLGSLAGWISIVFRGSEDEGFGIGPNLPSGIPLAAFYFITVAGGVLVAVVGLNMRKAARSRQHGRVISQTLLAIVILFGVVKAVDYAKGSAPYSYLLPHFASCKIPQGKVPVDGMVGFGSNKPTLRQWVCFGEKTNQ